jgi:signal transduction histidine kinase
VLITVTERSVKIVTDLFTDRLAEAHAELDGFTENELAAILRFLRSSTNRHERAAAQLRTLPKA